jgi:hypothetical protein
MEPVLRTQNASKARIERIRYRRRKRFMAAFPSEAERVAYLVKRIEGARR